MSPQRRTYPRGGSRVAFRPRRRYEWFSSAATQNPAPGGTGTTVLLNQTDITDLTEPTLKRVRGSLLVAADAVTAATSLAIGLMVVQLDELGNPPQVNAWDQEGSSYLWFHFVVIADFGGGHRYERIEVDSKAQRRIESDEGLVLFSQNYAGSATPTVFFQGRYLLEQV